MIAISWSGQTIERRTSDRTGKSMAGRSRGLPRLTVVAVMALFALSIAAVPATAASTFDWSLSCKGNAKAVAAWTWTRDDAPISGGGATCQNDEVVGVSGAARPDGANGIRGSVVIAGGCVELRFKDLSEVFSVDGSFKAKVTVSLTENSKAEMCSGHFHETATLSISG